MESHGYCTKNAQDMFEVNWTTEGNLLTKLFKRKTDFVFMTKGLNKENWLARAGYYHHYRWFDDQGNIVTCTKTLNKINKVLMSMAISQTYN